MKILLFTTAALTLVTSAFAQFPVIFANASTTPSLPPANRNVVWGPNASLLYPALVTGANVSSNYAGLNLSGLRVQLYYGTGTDVNQFAPAPNSSISTFRQSTSFVAGSWISKSASLTGVSLGDTVNLAIFVWQSELTSDPRSLAAQSGLWGYSGLFTFTMPSSEAPAPSELLMLNFYGMTVDAVPEPGVLTMLALGLASLLTVPRRMCEPPRK